MYFWSLNQARHKLVCAAMDVIQRKRDLRRKTLKKLGCDSLCEPVHGVQRRMISVDTFFVFLILSIFALLLLYVT